MRSRFHWLWCGRALLLALAALAAVVPALGASRRTEVVIVLDASVAMQQPLEADTRMVAASNAVARTLERYGRRNRIGVIAFGHRRQRTCDDIEIIKAVRAPVDETIVRMIAELKPQGPAPIAKSIDFASRAVSGSQGPARIVLVTASPDTCEADPCAVATLLAGTRAIRIDVIAIGSAEHSAFKPLKCVAKKTGGTFTGIASAVELASALSAAIVASLAAPLEEKAVLEGDPATATGEGAAGWTTEAEGAGTPQAGGDVAAAATAAFGETSPEGEALAEFAAGRSTSSITLTGLLADPGPQLTSGLVWRIYDGIGPSDADPKLLATYRQPQPTVALPAGEFLVNVAYGRANLTRRIKVVDGVPLAEQFVLNAGGLRLSAKHVGGSDIPAQSVTFDVYADERDRRGDRILILRGAQAGIVIRLNAGIYHLVSTYGDVNAAVAADISVEAGKLTEVVVEHTGTPVSLRLVLQRGGEALADVTWRIYTPEGEIVNESAGALPTHVLAPGRYLVEASRGGERYGEPLLLEPGLAKQLEIVVPR